MAVSRSRPGTKGANQQIAGCTFEQATEQSSSVRSDSRGHLTVPAKVHFMIPRGTEPTAWKQFISKNHSLRPSQFKLCFGADVGSHHPSKPPVVLIASDLRNYDDGKTVTLSNGPREQAVTLVRQSAGALEWLWALPNWPFWLGCEHWFNGYGGLAPAPTYPRSSAAMFLDVGHAFRLPLNYYVPVFYLLQELKIVTQDGGQMMAWRLRRFSDINQALRHLFSDALDGIMTVGSFAIVSETASPPLTARNIGCWRICY